jgi:hypothetical protein
MDDDLKVTLGLNWDQRLEITAQTLEQMLRDELHMAADIGPDDDKPVTPHLQAVLAHISSQESVDELLDRITAEVVARMESRQ